MALTELHNGQTGRIISFQDNVEGLLEAMEMGFVLGTPVTMIDSETDPIRVECRGRQYGIPLTLADTMIVEVEDA